MAILSIAIPVGQGHSVILLGLSAPYVLTEQKAQHILVPLATLVKRGLTQRAPTPVA